MAAAGTKRPANGAPPHCHPDFAGGHTPPAAPGGTFARTSSPNAFPNAAPIVNPHA